MITLQHKKSSVESIRDRIKAASAVYLADFTGLSVQLVTRLRKDMRAKGVAMRVMKNTLIGRVLHDCGIDGLDGHLKGPTALIIASADDPIEPARILTDFYKDNANLLPVKVVRMEDQTWPGSQIKELAAMPGRRDLQAQVVTLALGPGSTLVGLIKGPGSKIAGQIKALVEKLEKSSS